MAGFIGSLISKVGIGEAGKKQMDKANENHRKRAQKLKEKKAAAEGKTYDEYKDEVNKPYLNTQKNIATQSLAGSNNNNTIDDASIQLDTTQLPSAQDPNKTETAVQAQEKLDSPSENAPTAPTEEAPIEQDNSDIENKPEAEEEKKQRYQMKSIWDAYRDGDIDANTRDYLMIDAISNSVHNLAQDQGKIAAAYGGGNFNANYKDSAWDQRNKEMMKQGISSEAATVEGSDKEMERQLQRIQAKAGNLSNEQKEYMLGASRTLKGLASKATTNTEKALLNSLAADVADGNIDGKGLIAIAGASGFSDLKQFIFGDDKK